MPRGFTLIEVVVAISIFACLVLSIFGLYATITTSIASFREKTVISSLAREKMEIARNLPYSEIGTISGNPHGELPDLFSPDQAAINGTSYQIYFSVSYSDDPADGTILHGTDFSPNDYKQVKLYVKNASTGKTSSFFTSFSPKGLEGQEGGGAISIKVFDAVGQPVQGASIHIENQAINPAINLSRLSDANGNWLEVGLPVSANSYHITVTKNGYSSDATYVSSPQNPNPAKPDATVAEEEVTQISFSIDKLSSLTFNVLNRYCAPMAGTALKINGSKLIGTPDVLKFSNDYTSNGSGQILLQNIEWDNYSAIALNPNYAIYGSSPAPQPLLPDTVQEVNLIIGPSSENSVLVVVRDSSGNPVEGAEINLQKNLISLGQKITGGSVLSQSSWLGGPGQEEVFDVTKYFSDDGNVSNNGELSGLRLAKTGENYASSGELISSTFDTGTAATNFTTLTWDPASQDPSTEIKFQLSGNNDNQSWSFTGPDGTAGTYYSVSGNLINLPQGSRYLRYKVFLSTSDPSKTPVLTSVGINYVSGCNTPGQVFFADLEAGEDYNIIASLPGYESQIIENYKIEGRKIVEILLNQ